MVKLELYPNDERYSVSPDGQVFDEKRQIYSKFSNSDRGYKFVSMSGRKRRVHRVVWETYVGPIPEGYEIHHINHDRTDNRLDNLELLTHAENLKKSKHRRVIPRNENSMLSQPVIQIYFDGREVYWPSMTEVKRRLGFNQGGISQCCRGCSRTYKGYRWKYAHR